MYYDENTKSAVNTALYEMELINKAKERLKEQEEFKKRLEAWNSKVPIYFIDINAITYAECNDFYFEGNKKKYTRTPKYYEYEKELVRKLKENKVIKIPEQIKHVRLDLEIMINYAQKDTDNVMKPFIDRLFKYLKRDDNCVKCISITNVIKVDEGQEGVYFKITGIPEDEFFRSKLSVQYDEQIKQQKRQNHKRFSPKLESW